MIINNTLIASAYEVSKEFYQKNITRQDAIDKLRDQGMNPGSAFIYLQVYKYLIDGQQFSRTLSAESFDYFLSKILSDFGKDQLLITLQALIKHIEYFEEIKNFKMGLVRDIYNKYLKIYSEGILTENIEDNDELSFPEGKEIYKLHKFKERNRQLVKLAKETHFKKDNRMSCQICNFSFVEAYGDLGKEFIEAHHTFPISELKAETPTKVEDLALVCSNCHRMLHRKRPWLTIDNLKELCRTQTDTSA